LKNNHLKQQVALTLLEGVGNKKAKTLLAYMGSVERIFSSKSSIQKQVPGFTKERFRKLDKTKALEKAAPIVEYIEKNGIQTTFYTDKEYPKKLKECVDSPMLLYRKGTFNFNPRRSISIVGTRNMTSYGKQIINELITTLAPYNVQVISGLAHGVDGYTHNKCLDHGLSTLAILGHGLDRIYPSQHRNLAKRMLNTEGCGLITEFPQDTRPDRENFPQRNRIVAGMTDATIIVESGEKGGSLITAHLANDYNRDVFAYPGNVNLSFSKGCNSLISNDKAHLITSGKDIIRLLEWKKGEEEKQVQTSLFEGLDGDERLIVKAIKEFEKISLDVLSVRLKKPVSCLSALLLGLEMKGVVMTLPGKKYVLGQP